MFFNCTNSFGGWPKLAIFRIFLEMVTWYDNRNVALVTNEMLHYCVIFWLFIQQMMTTRPCLGIKGWMSSITGMYHCAHGGSLR